MSKPPPSPTTYYVVFSTVMNGVPKTASQSKTLSPLTCTCDQRKKVTNTALFPSLPNTLPRCIVFQPPQFFVLKRSLEGLRVTKLTGFFLILSEIPQHEYFWPAWLLEALSLLSAQFIPLLTLVGSSFYASNGQVNIGIHHNPWDG